MTSILIALIIGTIAYIIKVLIDLNAFVLIITKEKELIKFTNDLDNKYQFIKGLY